MIFDPDPVLICPQHAHPRDPAGTLAASRARRPLPTRGRRLDLAPAHSSSDRDAEHTGTTAVNAVKFRLDRAARDCQQALPGRRRSARRPQLGRQAGRAQKSRARARIAPRCSPARRGLPRRAALVSAAGLPVGGHDGAAGRWRMISQALHGSNSGQTPETKGHGHNSEVPESQFGHRSFAKPEIAGRP